MNKTVKELMVLHFLNDGVRTTFVTMLPFIAKDLSLNLTSVGFLGSVQPLVASILAFPAGFLATRLGGFRLLMSLLTVYSLGALVVGLSPNAFILIPAFFIGALGFGMFHTAGFSLIAKNSSESNIGRNMGDFTSIGDIGRVLMPPLAVFVVSFSGWRSSMFLISALGFLVYIFIRFFIPKKESGEIKQKLEVKENHKDFVRAIFNLLKTKKLFLTLLASVIDSLASSPVYIFLPFLLLAKGIHITQYGIATGIFFIGSLFGRTVLGRGVDKIGNLKVFIVSETFMAGMLVCLALSSNFLLILLFVFLLGMFTRGTTPVVQTMFSQASHKMHYDKIYAISELFIGLAAVVTIILMGIIADKIGVYFVFYTSALLALFAIVPTLFLSKVSSQID